MSNINLIGESADPKLAGVLGSCLGSGGYGVWGICDSGHGVHGESKGSRGVVGTSDTFHGVYGKSAANVGVAGESDAMHGVIGVSHSAAGCGVQGTNDATGSGDGVVGLGWRGVVGLSEKFQGVYGKSGANAGVCGESDQFNGVWGISHFQFGSGVYGANESGGRGVEGHGPTGWGVWGHSDSGTGVVGESKSGVGVFGKGGQWAARFEGNVEVTGDISMSNADCAEDFDITALGAVEAGTVMVLDGTGGLAVSDQAYDRRVVGVVSGAGSYKPAIVLDRHASRGNRQPIALMGKVYCKVDASEVAIQAGDLLTTSATPGHAMKASDSAKGFGAVIGKALRPLAAGQHALIPILIALQ
jgi:hypothetical protein